MQDVKRFDVILIHADTCWVARCLQYDVAAHGKDVFETLQNFEDIFLEQVNLNLQLGKPAIEDFPAPQRVFDLFAQTNNIKDHIILTLPSGKIVKFNVGIC